MERKHDDRPRSDVQSSYRRNRVLSPILSLVYLGVHLLRTTLYISSFGDIIGCRAKTIRTFRTIGHSSRYRRVEALIAQSCCCCGDPHTHCLRIWGRSRSSGDVLNSFDMDTGEESHIAGFSLVAKRLNVSDASTAGLSPRYKAYRVRRIPQAHHPSSEVAIGQ